MFDEIGKIDIRVRLPRVDDGVHIPVLKVHLACVDRLFFTVGVIELDTAGNHGTHEDSRMSMPAAVSSRGQDQMLYIEVCCAVRMYLGAPGFNAAVGVSRNFRLLVYVPNIDALCQDGVNEKSKGRGSQCRGRQS